MRLSITTIALIFALLFLADTASAESKTLVTQNKRAPEIQQLLERHTVAVQKVKKGVRISTDGRYGLSTRSFPPWRTEFILPESGIFELKPRQGSWEVFKIKEITPEGVLIDYEIGLSHQSIGNDLVVKDIGEVLLRYKGKK